MINSAKHTFLFSDDLSVAGESLVSLRKNITSLYTENRHKPHRFSIIIIIIIVSNIYIYSTYKYCTQSAAVSVSEASKTGKGHEEEEEGLISDTQIYVFSCKNTESKVLDVQICVCLR